MKTPSDKFISQLMMHLGITQVPLPKLNDLKKIIIRALNAFIESRQPYHKMESFFGIWIQKRIDGVTNTFDGFK